MDMTQIMVMGKPSGSGENIRAHPEVLDPALPRAGRSRTHRECPKIRFDIPGGVFWDGEVFLEGDGVLGENTTGWVKHRGDTSVS